MIAVSNRSDYQLVPHEPAALNLSEESMKTHKVALAFLLAHVAIFSLAVLCLDHPDLTGGILNYKAYDAINLTISSVFFVYTCRHYNASPRETGRICGYEFFASVMPMQTLMSTIVILTQQGSPDTGSTVRYVVATIMNVWCLANPPQISSPRAVMMDQEENTVRTFAV